MLMKIFAYISLFLTGLCAGYILCHQLTPPCETQVVKKQKVKGDGNTVTIQQIRELEDALKDCRKEKEKEEKQAGKEERKAKKRQQKN
jgi:TfoX/Sxy family transcriptional regulator of competence genes